MLEANCKITKENNDPEKRKYAIQAIEALFEELGFETDHLDETVIGKVFDILSATV